MSSKGNFHSRFYLRGTTWLGLLNTLLAYLSNRVIVRHVDERGKTVKWSVGRGTDFPPARREEKDDE